MDKSLFLMISALTSNLQQGHSGRPVRLHIHSSLERKFVEWFGYLGYQESRAWAPVKMWWRGSEEAGERGLNGIEGAFTEILAEWS